MSYRFLIVDDSAVTRSMIRKIIGMTGLPVGAVFEAGHGAEALEVMGREWVDIVLADLNMPQMTGVELVERMSHDPVLATIPVVVVSSERREATVKRLQELGAREYIRKPFRPEDVRAAIESVLAAGGRKG